MRLLGGYSDNFGVAKCLFFLSPVPAETHPERLLRLSDVVELTALSRATVYRQVAAGSFPAPVKIAGASRWSGERDRAASSRP